MHPLAVNCPLMNFPIDSEYLAEWDELPLGLDAIPWHWRLNMVHLALILRTDVQCCFLILNGA